MQSNGVIKDITLFHGLSIWSHASLTYNAVGGDGGIQDTIRFPCASNVHILSHREFTVLDVVQVVGSFVFAIIVNEGLRR